MNFKFKPFLIAIILVMVTSLLLPSGIFANETYDGTEMPAYEYEFIKKLSIADDTLQEDSVLTRAMACSMAVRMQNYTAVSDDVQNVYADVRKEDKYYNDIVNASALGIINGHPGALFMPDDEVTYMQFYKMIIETLGYGDFATVGGGYPVGYLRLVNSLDINDGVTDNADEKVTFANAVRIIYNALNTEVCDIDSVYDYDGETILDYHTKDGETLLSKYFDIKKVSGIISATAISSLTSESGAVSEDEIQLDETTFTGALPKDCEKLGYCADVYYTEKNKIYFVVVNSFENDVEKFEAKEIVDFDIASNTYEFEANGRIYRETLSKTVDVIINEKACPAYTKSDMIPSSGEVLFIDNNDDGKTDVVKITSYLHYVVGGVDTVNGLIYAKNRSDIVTIDIEEGNTIVAYGDTNDEFSLAGIRNDVVLSIAKSTNDAGISYVKVYTSTKEASGEISEVSGDYEHISLGGEMFDVDKDYAQALLQEGKIIPSVYAVLRINAFGDVVYADTDAINGKKYGFLLDVSKPSGGLSQKYSVRLIDSDSEIKVFECNETIALNQEKVDAQKLEEKLGYTFAPGNVHTVRQIVTYETNASGIMTSLETYDDFGKNVVSGIHVRGDLFGKGTRLAGDAPVFVVPNDENINTTDIKSGFTVLKASDVENDTSRTMEFFDYNDYRFAQAAVDYVAFGSKTAKIDGEYPLMLIDRATTVFDEDGNETLKITGTVSGKVTEEVLYDNLITYRDREGVLMQSYTPKSGDVIIYSKNTVGKVNCIYVFFTKEDLKKDFFIHSTHSAKRYDHMMTVVSGRVTQYAYGKDVVMQSTDILASDVSGATFTILTDKGFETGSAADLSIGDFVVARLRYGVVKEFVIIRL